MEGKRQGYLLNSNFVFSEPVEIIKFLQTRCWNILVIFDELGVCVSSGCFQHSLLLVEVQLTAMSLDTVSALFLLAEKTIGSSHRSSHSLMREFLFAAKKLLFLGMHQFCFLSEASWETYFWIYFIWFPSHVHYWLFVFRRQMLSLILFGIMDVNIQMPHPLSNSHS